MQESWRVDPFIRVDPSQLQVEPGGQVRTVVTVMNQGIIVDGFRLTVVGEGPSSWATIDPPELRIDVGQADSATVTFTPPAGRASVGGSYPFGILATSMVPSATSVASAAAEGDVVVSTVFHLQSKITPATSSGRWKARHVIEITNEGNTPVRLRLTPADPDQRLGFLLLPQTVDVPIGGTVSSQLRVRTRKPMLRGTATRLPFQVTAAPVDLEDSETVVNTAIDPRRTSVDGAFTQRPVLSRAATVAGVVLAVAAVAAVGVFALRGNTPAQVPLVGSGPPSTPALTVTSADAQSVKLNWTPQPNLNGYKVFTVTADGIGISGVKEIDGALNTLTVDNVPPNTAQCFRLQAIRGDQSSLPSDPQCATTAAAPIASSALAAQPGDASSAAASSAGAPVSSSTPEGSSPSSTAEASTVPSGTQPTATSPAAIADTDYIAVAYTEPVENSGAKQLAEIFAAGLVTGSLKAAVLRTSDYPNFGVGKPVPNRVDSYMVYVGPFKSGAEAQDYCAHHGDWPDGCIALRPGPKSPTVTPSASVTPTS